MVVEPAVAVVVVVVPDFLVVVVPGDAEVEPGAVPADGAAVDFVTASQCVTGEASDELSSASGRCSVPGSISVIAVDPSGAFDIPATTLKSSLLMPGEDE